MKSHGLKRLLLSNQANTLFETPDVFLFNRTLSPTRSLGRARLRNRFYTIDSKSNFHCLGSHEQVFFNTGMNRVIVLLHDEGKVRVLAAVK